MKYVSLFIAAVALAGCDITLGSNGPVITQSDSIIRRVVPMGAQTPSASDRVAVSNQTTATQTGTAAAPAQPAPERTPITLASLTAVTPLPVGVTRAQVETFKTAVADEGCVIATRQQRAAVQSRTGFDQEKTDRIIAFIWRDGDLERNSGNYVLTSGRCSDG